jgi:hypothetical protein
MEWACKLETPAFILFGVMGLLATAFAEIHYARVAYALCKHKSQFKNFRHFLGAFGQHSGSVRKIWFYDSPSVHPDDMAIIEEYAGRSRLIFWAFVGLIFILFVVSINACK